MAHMQDGFLMKMIAEAYFHSLALENKAEDKSKAKTSSLRSPRGSASDRNKRLKQGSSSKRSPKAERNSHFKWDPGATRSPASKHRENKVKAVIPKPASN